MTIYSDICLFVSGFFFGLTIGKWKKEFPHGLWYEIKELWHEAEQEHCEYDEKSQEPFPMPHPESAHNA